MIWNSNNWKKRLINKHNWISYRTDFWIQYTPFARSNTIIQISKQLQTARLIVKLFKHVSLNVQQLFNNHSKALKMTVLKFRQKELLVNFKLLFIKQKKWHSYYLLYAVYNCRIRIMSRLAHFRLLPNFVLVL